MDKKFLLKLKDIVSDKKKKIRKMVGSAINHRDITLSELKEDKNYLKKFLEVLYINMPFKMQTSIKKEDFIQEIQLAKELIGNK